MSEPQKPPLGLPLAQYLDSGLSAEAQERCAARLRARRDIGRDPARQRSEPERAPLPRPLGPFLLRGGGDDAIAARARLWRAVHARVHRPKKRVLRRRYALACAAVSGALAALALAALFWSPWTAPWIAQKLAPASRGVLVTAEGSPLSTLDAHSAPQRVLLADRSEIRLAKGGRLEPVRLDPSRVELLLKKGTADFSVTPGGPRRWSIEAGAARVEVVGTVFRVERTAREVRVSVSHGSVVVLADELSGGARRLNAGESLSIGGRSEASKGAPRTDPSVPEAAPPLRQGAADPAAGALPASGAQPATPSLAPRTQTGARRRSARPTPSGQGSPAERYARLGPSGIARETMRATSVEQLLELADIARLSGHPEDAVAPLTRALDAFRGERQATLAAFTLGRVLLDQLDLPLPAAEAFERAIALGLPKALRADCYRRLGEAYGRAGKKDLQNQAEARYQAEFALPSSVLDRVAP